MIEKGHLTLEERQQIYKMRSRGESMQKIGVAIGRDKSVISRELRRNTTITGFKLLQTPYEEAKAAHDKALRRRSDCKRGRRGPLKLAAVRSHVEKSLAENKYSPEAIAADLKRSDQGVTISGMTLRRWLITDAPELRQYLALKGKKRRNRLTPKKKLFGDGSQKRSIHNRPKDVSDRARVGDFEADLVVCSQSNTAILSIRERSTRHAWLRLLPNRTAEATRKAIVGVFANIPPQLRLTCTFDNGSEFAKVHEVERLLGIEQYFCDAYSAWQKGSVEQQNKEIRLYIPKGTDLSKVSEERLREIEKLLNNKPRPCLKNDTAAQSWCLALEQNRHLLH